MLALAAVGAAINPAVSTDAALATFDLKDMRLLPRSLSGRMSVGV